MACVGCKSVRRKCEKDEGKDQCRRCFVKKLDCVAFARKKRLRVGSSCLRCQSLHRACSLTSEEESNPPCDECMKRNAECFVSSESKSSKVEVCSETGVSIASLSLDAKPRAAPLNPALLALALEAPIESLERMHPNDIPAAFGFGSGVLGESWLLVAVSPPGPGGFTRDTYHKGTRIVSGVVQEHFKAVFNLEHARGKSWWDLGSCKTEAEFEQLKCMLQVDPRPAHVKVALEITRGLAGVGETAIVLHSVFDNKGIARLQFLSFSLVDEDMLAARNRSAFVDLPGLEWLDDFEFGAVSTSDEGMQFFDLDMIL